MDASDSARCTATSDPIYDVVDHTRSSTDQIKLRSAIHTPRLTWGFCDAEETYATTMRWMKEIILAPPPPQLMDLSAEFADFSLRYMLPLPHRQAACALSSTNVRPKEDILQGTYATTMRWLQEIILAQSSPQRMDLARNPLISLFATCCRCLIARQYVR